MSGHSKWAQIKRQKGAADQRRGTLYTKLAHGISVAVREGGKDPDMNVRLRLAVDRARSANMPNATIERAIQRGAGELGGQAPTVVLYEAFGPEGVALLIEALTDNSNRTTADIRHLLTKHGGSLGTTGSVQWQFTQYGKMEIPTDITEEQQLAIIDGGAEDLQRVTDGWVVLTKPQDLMRVKDVIEQFGLPTSDHETLFLPKDEGKALSTGASQRVETLVAALEELDDVSTVTSNATA